MRAAHTLLLLALASAPALALAQTNAPNAPQGASSGREQLSTSEQQEPGRLNQRTQRIQVEDAGSRVDEVRVGGQTQSISVQPKAGNMPSYEVQSPDGARSRAGANSGAETSTAPRVWNVLKF